jgi:PncC family amidohydrolase
MVVGMKSIGWRLNGDWNQKLQKMKEQAEVKNLTFAFAESCTGGMLSSVVTKVPGISSVYKGSYIAYSEDFKIHLLGVPSQLIEKFGVVSEPVALSMAQGIKRLAKVDLSLAITGFTGPEGGTQDKPVGTVCFAATGLGSYSMVKTQFFQGSRDQIQESSVSYALDLVLDLVNV